MVTTDRKRGRRPSRARRFYDEALTEAEKLALPEAMAVQGIEQEVALLRLRLRQAIEERPDDLPLMFRGIETLARVVSSRYSLSKADEQELVEKLRGALESIKDVWPEGFNDDR